MKALVDKTYWIMMPPFLVGSILLLIFLPPGKTYWAFGVILLFWIAYYSVKYIQRKKNNIDNSPLKEDN